MTIRQLRTPGPHLPSTPRSHRAVVVSWVGARRVSASVLARDGGDDGGDDGDDTGDDDAGGEGGSTELLGVSSAGVALLGFGVSIGAGGGGVGVVAAGTGVAGRTVACCEGTVRPMTAGTSPRRVDPDWSRRASRTRTGA
ncbi:hypothetical protein [Embleya sp. NBC_00896]|uniref:hypothetical protein n=1 Tax=Embleya sp. NBC_00896 TaxID=2975961 RepID=UPI00386F63E7|nr:hypothetical protein OG928_07650 [Embleya sp. NBC_00896]